MRIYPAIDLKEGKCVRLLQGRMEDATIYSDNPPEMARKWESLGAKVLHIVDLDAAIHGDPRNFDTICSIIDAINIPVQIGGGIRNSEIAEKYLAMDGVKRIIVGTAACENPDFVKALTSETHRVTVGIDAKDGFVAVKGWVDTIDKTAIELALEFQGMGVNSIVYTDISKDGMMQGPNVGATKELMDAVDIPIIASGGVSSIEDLRELREVCGPKLDGAIVGKSIYTGAIDLEVAFKEFD